MPKSYWLGCLALLTLIGCRSADKQPKASLPMKSIIQPGAESPASRIEKPKLTTPELPTASLPVPSPKPLAMEPVAPPSTVPTVMTPPAILPAPQSNSLSETPPPTGEAPGGIIMPALPPTK